MQNALWGKTCWAIQIIELLVPSLFGWFVFIPNISTLYKSEHACPYSILMQESKDMREKDIKAKIFREVKVTNIG